MNLAGVKSAILLMALSGTGFAQTTLHTTSTLVVVPTLVQTPGKDLVFSLKADDFTLTDNGVLQKVMLEDESSRPLSLVVLMQTGGAARGQFPNYANLETMIAAILGDAPNKVSVVNFDTAWRALLLLPPMSPSGAMRLTVPIPATAARRFSMALRMRLAC